MSKKKGSHKIQLTHNQIREKLCIVCLQTAEKRVPDKVLETLKSLFPDFSTDQSDVRIPRGICATHRIYLGSKSKTKDRSKAIEKITLACKNFDVVDVPDPENTTCQCLLCDRVRGKAVNLKYSKIDPKLSAIEEVVEIDVPVIETEEPTPFQDSGFLDVSDLFKNDEVPSNTSPTPLSPKRYNCDYCHSKIAKAGWRLLSQVDMDSSD